MDDITLTEDSIDLDALRRGDKAAFALLVELYADPLYNLTFKLLNHPQEAEDALQETLLSAYKNIGSFEGRSSLGTWLYRIAYNAAMMRLRKKRPQTISIDEPVALDNGEMVPRQFFDWCCLPESDLLGSEALAHMDEVIAAMPETLKSVFILRDIEGLSTAETGEALDLSEAAVKSRLHRARLYLREQLSDYFAEWVEKDGNGHE